MQEDSSVLKFFTYARKSVMLSLYEGRIYQTIDNNQQNNKSNLQVSVNENHNITHTVNLLQYIQVRQWGHLGHTSTSFRLPETPL